TGNTYTYSQLGSIPRTYPVPKPVRVTAAEIAKQLARAPRAPRQAASAGSQRQGALAPASVTRTLAPASAGTQRVSHATKPAKPGKRGKPAESAKASAPAGVLKVRLFADPGRPASYAAGGNLQMQSSR